MKKLIVKTTRGILYGIQSIMKAKKVVFTEEQERFDTLMIKDLKGDCCDNILCETTGVKPKITRGKRYEILNTSNEGFCILDDNRKHVTFSWFKTGWKLTRI